ncbi:hypothetical protein D3C85_1371480 [compost metagenome]
MPITLGPRFGFGATNKRHDRRQHFAAVSLAPLLHDLRTHLVTEGAHGGQMWMNSEDRLGPTRAETSTTTRRAGLDQHRPTLGSTRNIQRAFDLEPLAVVLHRVDLRWIGQHPTLAVELERVCSPTTP